MQLIEHLRAELEQRMAENPKIALKHELFIDCSFPITEMTLDDHPALAVGKNVIVFPIPAAIRLPADYDGAVRIAVLSSTRPSATSIEVNKALGLAGPKRTLTDLKLSVADAAATAIMAASGMRFIEMALQGAFAGTNKASPQLDAGSRSALSDEIVEAARAIDFYDGGLPPLHLFHVFARELGLSYSETSPMRDAHRNTSIEYVPIGDRTALAIDDHLLLVPDDDLPISTFPEHEREGEEWRSARPGIATVIRNVNPIETLLKRSIPTLGFEEFSGTDCYVTWAGAFHAVFVMHVLERDLRNGLDAED